MGIVNRRNAVLGWAVWTVGKQVMQRKAKAALPTIEGKSRRVAAVPLALLALAGAAAAAYVVLRRGEGDDTFGP